MNTHDNAPVVPDYFDADKDETHFVTQFTDAMKFAWEGNSERPAFQTIRSRGMTLGIQSHSDADHSHAYYYLFNVDMLLCEERISDSENFSRRSTIYKLDGTDFNGSWTTVSETVTRTDGEVVATEYRTPNALIFCPIAFELSKKIAAQPRPDINSITRSDLVIPATRPESGYWDMLAHAFEVTVVGMNQDRIDTSRWQVSGVDPELADNFVSRLYSAAEIDEAAERIFLFQAATAKILANGYADTDNGTYRLRVDKVVESIVKLYGRVERKIVATATRTYGDVFLQGMRVSLKVAALAMVNNIGAASGTCLLQAKYALMIGGLVRAYRKDQSEIHAIIDGILDDGDRVDYDVCVEFLNEQDFIQCSDCDEWELGDNARTTFDSSDPVCRGCIESRYTFSDYHDEWVHNDNVCHGYDQNGEEVAFHSDCDDFSYDDDSGEYYHYNYEKGSNLINSYHTAKNRGLYKKISSDWTERNKRFMGIELEVEIRNRDTKRGDVAERLNAVINDGTLGKRVWFEEDGSLTSGIEIISNPMGLDTHTEFWTWLQDKDLVRGLRSHDTSTCGLHIHVSRRGMNNLQVAKINTFVNHPDNAELISKVARRYSSSYARIAEKQLSKAHYDADRYDAVNLNNSQTIEFRIFKGTLKYESLMAAVEFVNAVVNFTMPASPAGFNLTTERFTRFIESFPVRGETKFLRSYLKMAADEATDLEAA